MLFGLKAKPGPLGPNSLFFLVIVEHTVFWAFDVFVLPAFHGPDENQPGTDACDQ